MRGDAVDLIRHVLGEYCPNDAAAMAFLERALAREVDPLRACAARLGASEAVVLQRAARWAGLHFRSQIPDRPLSDQHHVRLDRLSQVHGLRLRKGAIDLTFCAPDFFAVLRLASARRHKPALAFRLCLVPDAALRQALARLAAAQLVDAARHGVTQKWPFATAELDLGKPVRWAFIVLVAALFALSMLAPLLHPLALMPLALLLIGGPALLRLGALLTPRERMDRVQQRPADAELPVYSILVPLRDEDHMVPQLARALRQLNYPPEKLDVLFVVEDRSPETIAAVEQHCTDAAFTLIPVPDARPRTKPKALNLALPLCRGEFVVVYDAEDTPHPDQLWQAVSRFRHDAALHCLQARLVIDNGKRHPMAALFAGEYAGVFAVLLPALARWRLPVPLGGTSNHFRLETLRALGGWDAFNVTEDADLGVRLARRRLKVAVFDSPTLEEAPTRIGSWIAQRSRWLKGWMQTFIVHNRRPVQLWRDLGTWPMLGFEIMTLGMFLAPLLHTGFFATVLLRLCLGLPVVDGLMSWSSFYASLFLFGYGTAVASAVMGLVRHRMGHLLRLQALLPLYWLLMVPATMRALRELATQPFYWAKTKHVTAPVRQFAPERRAPAAANENRPLPAEQPVAAQ